MAAAKKAKGSSFSKSSTKAGSAAYNTKNKVRIAKELKSRIEKARDPLSSSKREQLLSRASGKVSQAITERTRSATRAAGIAKRVAKKGK